MNLIRSRFQAIGHMVSTCAPKRKAGTHRCRCDEDFKHKVRDDKVRDIHPCFICKQIRNCDEEKCALGSESKRSWQ